MDYQTILKEKINNLTSNKWTVPEFQKEYYTYYLEQVPGDVLTLAQSTFYGLVQEKLDWTSQNPTLEEKRDGWFNYSEYIEWLKKNNQDFLMNEEKWYENYTKNFKIAT